jgi:hypothetical protein
VNVKNKAAAGCLLIHYPIHFSIALVFLSAVTNKMTAGAKSFGSFFTGVVNKAGAKIKESVKDNVSDCASCKFYVLIVALFYYVRLAVDSRRVQQGARSIH